MHDHPDQPPPNPVTDDPPPCADPQPLDDSSLLPLEAAAADVATATRPDLPEISPDDLAEQVAASNIRVIWRGGITLSDIFSVATSVVINAGLALALWFMFQIGMAWEAKSRPDRDFLVHTYISPTVDDGGSGGGGMLKDTAPNVDPDPSIGGLKFAGSVGAGSANDGFPLPSNTDHATAAAGDDSLRRPGFISLGPAATPRLGKKHPGIPGNARPGPGGNAGDHATANSPGDGNGGSDFSIAVSDFVKNPGPGGSGGGMGRGKGAGWDRGFSVDSAPQCLDTPKFNIPEAYRLGLIRVKQSAKFTIWIKPDNSVARIELVQSSGDKLFDSAIEQFYLHARYLAGTRNGEPAELPLPVGFGSD